MQRLINRVTSSRHPEPTALDDSPSAGAKLFPLSGVASIMAEQEEDFSSMPLLDRWVHKAGAS
jgi:hypothetical protein